MTKLRGIFCLIVFIMCCKPVYADYVMPVGIPDPSISWGANQDPIDDAAPPVPSPWSGEIAGYYYIDSSGTDSGRTYGYPGAPRRTIPATLPAGSLVVIAGDDFNTSPNITCNGTSDAWSANRAGAVWIKGVDGSEPTFNGFTVKGTYFYIEEVKIDTYAGFDFGWQTTFGVFRNSEIHDTGNVLSASGAAIGMEGASDVSRNTYMIVYNVLIHDIGAVVDVAGDWHGIKPRIHCRYIWLLNNTIYNTQADGIQTGEASETDHASYVYMGRNTISYCKENCIDTKDGTDFIISENVCSGMRLQTVGNDVGTGITLHESSDWVWFINNRIYDCNQGVTGTSGMTNVYFIGNVVYDINHAGTSLTNYSEPGAAFVIRGVTTSYFINNTIYDSDKGIAIGDSNGPYGVSGNLFSHRSLDSYDIGMAGDPAAAADVNYNLFDTTPGTRINIGGTVYTSVAAYNAATSECANCVEGLPSFKTPGSDFSLQSDSDAIGKNTEDAIYAAFYSRYGIDIKKDLAGNRRPRGATWDSGAYEYRAGGSAISTLLLLF